MKEEVLLKDLKFRKSWHYFKKRIIVTGSIKVLG